MSVGKYFSRGWKATKNFETALGRAAELQDGGGGNGSAFDTR